MKIVFFLLSFLSFANSEYLLTLEQDNNRGTLIYCIKYYSYKQNKILFTDITDTNYSLNTKQYQNINVEIGYKNNNGVCYLDRSDLLGLDYNQFNFLMAVFGIFLSVLISYGLIKVS